MQTLPFRTIPAGIVLYRKYPPPGYQFTCCINDLINFTYVLLGTVYFYEVGVGWWNLRGGGGSHANKKLAFKGGQPRKYGL